MMIFSQKRPKYGEDPNFVPNTIIGEGVTFRGHIKGVNAVMVSGLVFGDINVDGEVIVTETGYVEGNIMSTFAVVSGIVEGDIILTSYASLKNTASVTGDITCTALNVEDGAVFTGKMNMVVKSGALAKKKRRINEQAAAMEAWQPRSAAEIVEQLPDPDLPDLPDEEEAGFAAFTAEDDANIGADLDADVAIRADEADDEHVDDDFHDIEDEEEDDGEWDSSEQDHEHLEALLRDEEEKEEV